MQTLGALVTKNGRGLLSPTHITYALIFVPFA